MQKVLSYGQSVGRRQQQQQQLCCCCVQLVVVSVCNNDNFQLYVYHTIYLYRSIYLPIYHTSLIQILLDQVEQYSSSSSTSNNNQDDYSHLNGSAIDYNPSIMNTTTTTNSTTTNNNPLTIIDIINYKKRNGQPLRFGVSRPGNGSHTMTHYTAILYDTILSYIILYYTTLYYRQWVTHYGTLYCYAVWGTGIRNSNCQ